MVEFRPVCLDDDVPFVLEMFVIRAFESATEADGRVGLKRYHESWLESHRAKMERKALEESLKDPRTIAEVVVVDGVDAGFLWCTFVDEPGHPTYVDLLLVAFKLNYQRRGLGRLAVQRVEQLAAERGADSIRSTGSAPTESVRRFHDSLGFVPIQTVYEKRLGAGRS